MCFGRVCLGNSQILSTTLLPEYGLKFYPQLLVKAYVRFSQLKSVHARALNEKLLHYTFKKIHVEAILTLTFQIYTYRQYPHNYIVFLLKKLFSMLFSSKTLLHMDVYLFFFNAVTYNLQHLKKNNKMIKFNFYLVVANLFQQLVDPPHSQISRINIIQFTRSTRCHKNLSQRQCRVTQLKKCAI